MEFTASHIANNDPPGVDSWDEYQVAIDDDNMFEILGVIVTPGYTGPIPSSVWFAAFDVIGTSGDSGVAYVNAEVSVPEPLSYMLVLTCAGLVIRRRFR